MGMSSSAAARGIGIGIEPRNFNSGNAQYLPQRVGIIGVGNDAASYTLDKYEVTGGAQDVGDRYGYGSPLHLAALQFFPTSGTWAGYPVTIYPLAKAGGGLAASGSIEVSGAATKSGQGAVYIGGVKALFSAAKGDTAAVVLASIKEAVDSVLSMPAVTGEIAASALPLTSKWSGAGSNKITLAVEADIAGIEFVVTAFSGGAVDPDVEPAFAKKGQVWETFFLNTLPYDDADRLDKYQSFGESQWDDLTHQPLMVCHGCTDAYAVRTAVTDERPLDYINFLVESVGSRELPFVVGAAGLKLIAETANTDPAQGYRGALTGLHAGADEVQEGYQVRDMSVKKGASTNIKTGSAAELQDIITFYHPASEGQFPLRRYVVDGVRAQNTVYNVYLIVDDAALRGAPLIPDGQVSANPRAVRPMDIKARLVNLADNLGLAAILSDPEFAKAGITVEIDSSNPNRVNWVFPCKFSGNVEIIAGTIYYGKYVGGAA